jgi:hypothetical protein
MNIDGIDYIVTDETSITMSWGEVRKMRYLKRPKGKKSYCIIIYGNGSTSKVI